MRFLSWLGIAVLVFVGLFAALFGYTSYKSNALEKTAVPYLRKAIPELARWDLATVKAYMAPEALKDLPDDKLAKVLAWESRLGRLQHMDNPRFVSIYSGADTTHGPYQIVTYTVPVRFDAGDGVVTVRLLVQGEGFKVFLFHVDSMALIGGEGPAPPPAPAAPADSSKI
jgi:hypothetical protein